MKTFFTNFYFLFVLLFCTTPSFSQQSTANKYVPPYPSTFGYGTNMGAYGNNWNDKSISTLVHKAGGNTMRTSLPEDFLEKWGYQIRLNEFKYYANDLDMNEITTFIGSPSEEHRDLTIYPGCTSSSKVFANLYEPIWKSDGSVNPENYYANYVFNLVQTYGPYIKNWEVVNEPDLGAHNPAAWLTRAPLPSELTNLRAPFYYYIRMLRITYEVVKKYNPTDYVTPGGIGHSYFLDALMRYTDNPNEGAVTAQYPNKGGAYFDMLSYHMYPSFSLRVWDNSIKGFKFLRNSDYAAATVMKHKKGLEEVLLKYGYNGVTYPKKPFIITETSISRRTIDWRYSSDEMQRNFGMKTIVLAQKNDIKQVDFFVLGESVDAPASETISSSIEYGLMGLYENLKRDAPGSEKLTQWGKGFKTTSSLLQGYTYDANRTAALNLPTTIEGGAFRKDGEYVYALWANNPTDKSENFSQTYSFPDALDISKVDRFEWDYSVTGKNTQQLSTGIKLNTTPTFFKGIAGDVEAKQNQTITFPSIGTKTYGVKPFTLQASSTSNLTVSFKVVSGPATITGNTITITGVGVVKVEANQSGNANYNAATAINQSFEVTKSTPIITFNAIPTQTLGASSFFLDATSTNTETPIAFTSSNKSVATVANINGDWKVTIVGAGTTNITASQSGDNNYNPAINVTRPLVVQTNNTVPDTEGRLKVTSISTSIDTGSDFTPWLTDDLSKLVKSNWSSKNNQYVDVVLDLENRSEVTRISMYDYQGVFTTNMAYVYALRGTERILLGTFTGTQYMSWVDIELNSPVTADAIIIRKYGNNIPQKVKVYGMVSNTLAQSSVSTRSQNQSSLFEMETQAFTWSVYPNPTVGKVEMRIGNQVSGELVITVNDLNGKTLDQVTLKKDTDEITHTLSLSKLKAGLYIIHLRGNGFSEAKRIIKE